MIKCTVQDIIAGQPVFAELLKQDFTGKKAFLIARLNRELEIEVREFERCRQELIEKYGVVDEQGNYTIPDDKLHDANMELADMLNVELEINNCDKIPADWVSECNLNPVQFSGLLPFIEM